jgi:hypothetical protein
MHGPQYITPVGVVVLLVLQLLMEIRKCQAQAQVRIWNLVW